MVSSSSFYAPRHPTQDIITKCLLDEDTKPVRAPIRATDTLTPTDRGPWAPSPWPTIIPLILCLWERPPWVHRVIHQKLWQVLCDFTVLCDTLVCNRTINNTHCNMPPTTRGICSRGPPCQPLETLLKKSRYASQIWHLRINRIAKWHMCYAPASGFRRGFALTHALFLPPSSRSTRPFIR